MFNKLTGVAILATLFSCGEYAFGQAVNPGSLQDDGWNPPNEADAAPGPLNNTIYNKNMAEFTRTVAKITN